MVQVLFVLGGHRSIAIAMMNRVEIVNHPWRAEEREEPLFNNTRAWLTSARLGNANESLVTLDYVHKLILNTSPLHILRGSREVLGQALGFPESRFMNWEKDESATQLAYRLAFLALHENQYGPAREEARSRIKRRRDPASSRVLAENSVGPFDFECDPGRKYLIADYGARRNGFGYTTLRFINNLLAAVSSGRVLISRGRRGNKLNSCPRHDLQCTFLPLSPCVLTSNDVDGGATIDLEQFKSLMTHGEVGDAAFDDAKVLVFRDVGWQYGNSSPHLMQRMKQLVTRLLGQQHFTSSEGKSEVIQQLGLTDERIEHAYKIMATEWFLQQTTWSYIMRPNVMARAEIDRLVTNALPIDFNPESSIGLAIRSGDKCIRESQCMPFDNYMDLVKVLSANRTAARADTTENARYDTIVLTSEDKTMLEARFNYTSRPDFPFRFVVNVEDVAQGHGSAGAYGERADDIMISSLTSAKLQLLSESVVRTIGSFFSLAQ